MTAEKKYIDVDEAFETIIDFAGQAETKSAYGAYWKAAKALKKLPSVSMPTIRTGRWVHEDDSICCSVCRFIFPDTDAWNRKHVHLFDFCPHCGSEMTY